MRLLALFCTATLLASCAANPRPRFSDQVIDRALAAAPGEAQPSRVVVTDLAFARAAREQGQWTASLAFAASGAKVHGTGGPVDAALLFAALKNPEQAMKWSPRAVWMSCDGGLAVGQGRFRDPQGLVGTYVMVWQRQIDGSYKWVHNAAGYDDPQPAPEPETEPEEGENIIVVENNDAQGFVADCRRQGEEMPPAPAYTISPPARGGGGRSVDGTLIWGWIHGGDGSRELSVDFLENSEWQKPLDQRFGPIESPDE